MKNPLVIVGIIVGLLFIIVAFIYFTTPANSLPSFFPGFDLSSSNIHTKHGIGSALLGLAAFAFAWFQSKSKSLPEKK